MKNILIALFLVLFIGCGSSPQSLDVSKRSRNINKDYNSTLKAIIDYCTNNGFPIMNVDKELGILNTDYKANENLGLPIVLQSRAKLNFSVKGISASQTKVICNISIQRLGGKTWTGSTNEWNEVEISEGQAIDCYNRVFEGIEKEF